MYIVSSQVNAKNIIDTCNKDASKATKSVIFTKASYIIQIMYSVAMYSCMYIPIIFQWWHTVDVHCFGLISEYFPKIL